MFSPCCFLIRLSLFHDKWVSHHYPVTDQSSYVFAVPINALAQLGPAFNHVPFLIPLYRAAISEQTAWQSVNHQDVSSSTRAAPTTEAQGLGGGVFGPPLLQSEKNSRRESSSQSPHPFGHLFPLTAWRSPCGMETGFWDVTSNAAAPT